MNDQVGSNEEATSCKLLEGITILGCDDGTHDTSERLFSDPGDKEDDEEVVDDKEGSRHSGCGGPGPEADTERGREQHSHQHYR